MELCKIFWVSHPPLPLSKARVFCSLSREELQPFVLENDLKPNTDNLKSFMKIAVLIVFFKTPIFNYFNISNINPYSIPRKTNIKDVIKQMVIFFALKVHVKSVQFDINFV